MHVPHHHRGRILLAEIPVFPALFHGFPVAKMIVPRHHESFFREEFGKFLVPLHILRHAMDDLQNAAHLLRILRRIPDRVQLGLSVS